MSQSEADLHKGLTNAANTLISRMCGVMPQDDQELWDLFEQWHGALTVALKYANDSRATMMADACVQQLVTTLKDRGITTF